MNEKDEIDVTSISKSYGKKISINFQSFSFDVSLTANLPKPNMTADELREYGYKVFCRAKQMVEDDVSLLKDDFAKIQNRVGPKS